MAVVTLPVRSDYPHYDFSVELDSRTYVLEFRWNERDGGWYLSISADDGEVLLSARKVTVDWPLTAQVRHVKMFKGELFAVDTTGQGKDPLEDDFGKRVVLLYVSPDELPEALKL